MQHLPPDKPVSKVTGCNDNPQSTLYPDTATRSRGRLHVSRAPGRRAGGQKTMRVRRRLTEHPQTALKGKWFPCCGELTVCI